MRNLLLVLVVAASAWGQGPIIIGQRPFLAQIREYLALTEVQFDRIQQQNSEFSRWSRTQSQRMFEVQREISVETARQPLDPVALGLRYAEVETIRRVIAERSAKLVPDNIAVLTDLQKMKLKALEEAMRLAETAGSEARGIRLVPDFCGDFGVAFAVPGDFASFLIGDYFSCGLRGINRIGFPLLP